MYIPWVQDSEKYGRPKLTDIHVTVENCKGESLDYNTLYRKVKEVNKFDTKVSVKSIELLIPFLQEWQQNESWIYCGLVC